MPREIAENVICDYGVKFNGKKMMYIPLDYIHWLYYHADGLPWLLEQAVKAYMEEKIDGWVLAD
jgi:hypothetical protein